LDDDSLFVLTYIIMSRFWQFKNGQRNPPCGIIIFEMRDPNVMTHDIFGNELGRTPPSAMRLTYLLTGQPIFYGGFVMPGTLKILHFGLMTRGIHGMGELTVRHISD
jgi:hypothetical protein